MAHQKKRRKATNPAIDRRVVELVKSTGISRALATQVALGRVELNDVLTRMSHKAEIESLMRRHELSRALASQVALGQADLESLLFKRRMAEHLALHSERSILVQAQLSAEPLSLALHGQRGVDGVVTKLDRYEFLFEPRGGEAETVHKLQVKFAVAADSRKKVRKSLSFDNELRKVPREPVWKPQDRYTCSNRRLFQLCDRQVAVEVLTLEGDVLRGKVAWVGRFEFGLEVKGGIEVVVFRHALAKLSEA